MLLSNLLTKDRVIANLKGGSKKRVLELAAEFIGAESGLDSDEIYQGLIDRERLGSTGIGFGVAIPHCRLNEIDTNDARGYLIQLNQGIDFDAIDEQTVRLLFVLLVPDSTNQLHLDILAQLANCFTDDIFRHNLQQATSTQELFDVAIQTFRKEPA